MTKKNGNPYHNFTCLSCPSEERFRIHIRVTASEKEFLKESAKRLGFRSFAEFIRVAAREKAEGK